MSIAIQPPLPGLDLPRRERSTSELIQQVIDAAHGDPTQLAQMANVVGQLVALRQSEERFAWEREERRMNLDFNQALTRVQEKVAFVNNNADGQKGNRYATFEALDRALRKHYLEEGFAVSFDSREGHQPNAVTVICHLSREAITREFSVPVLVDGSGPKGGGVMTGSQASIAAFSYGCRALLRRIFNVRTGEEDNDGNAFVPNQQIVDLIAVIVNAATIQDGKEAYNKAFALAREEKDGGRALAAVVGAWEETKKGFASKGVHRQ